MLFIPNINGGLETPAIVLQVPCTSMVRFGNPFAMYSEPPLIYIAVRRFARAIFTCIETCGSVFCFELSLVNAVEQ